MILFLHGPDTYRSRQKLREITSSYEKAHQNQVRTFYFDCTETPLDSIQATLETMSLFERKKLAVVENIFQDAAAVSWFEAQKEAFERSQRHIVVLFEAGEVKQKTKNKLYQWLKKHAKQQEFSLLSLAKVKLWMKKEFEQYGLQVAPLAQEMLARAAGNDLWRLSNEIRKIAAFKKSEHSSQVREGDVALFVTAATETDVFATIDAVASKNKKQAFALLYRHLKKGDSPHYLFSMLQYQFRTLLEIRELLDRDISREKMAQQTRLHPYVLQKGIRVAECFSLPELKQIYQKLFRIDWDTKTGRQEPEAALDTFLATLERPLVRVS